MESSLSPILMTLGLVFAIYAILVESISEHVVKTTPPPSPRRTPPSPLQRPRPSTPTSTRSLPPPSSPPPLRVSPSPPAGTPTTPPSTPAPPPHKTSDSRKQDPPPPPPHEKKRNMGKKMGLLFAGFAGILQIGVVGFLVFKRRQLLVIKDRYETCST
ncbi:hypothetical protein ACOSQ2_020337 [Xanthoceras sorbifolium]